MRKIRSPFLVTFYGLSRSHETLVMEIMTLGSLHGAIQEKASFILPVDIRIQVMLDVIQGLEYLHGLNCIHGDVKSPNVLLTEDGGSLRAKLSDFGFSHIRHRPDSTSIASAVSLKWAAPELFEKPAVITPSADIYSYGVVVWELLTLKQPFSDCSSSPVSIVTRVMAGERDAIPILGTPPTILEAIQACWVRSPGYRPTAQTLRMKLQAENKPKIVQLSIDIIHKSSTENSDNYERRRSDNSIILS